MGQNQKQKGLDKFLKEVVGFLWSFSVYLFDFHCFDRIRIPGGKEPMEQLCNQSQLHWLTTYQYAELMKIAHGNCQEYMM